jgi:uncharacterized protein YbjT (DUF2867 family)
MVRQQTAAVDAAIDAGVRHIVRVSSAGAAFSSDRAISRWHAAVDAHVERSGAAFALLRPTFFTQNLLNSGESVRKERRLYGAFGRGRLAFVDCLDIAECAAVLLDGPAETRGALLLTGRETLSFDEVAGKLSERLGRSIDYVDRPVAEIVASMKARGVPETMADSFGKMMAFFSSGGASSVTSTVKDLTGRDARTVDDFLDDNIDRFR